MEAQESAREIVICMGSSCFSRGNKQSVGIIKSYLKKNGLESQIVLKGSHCFGICEKGPVITVNGVKMERVNPDRVTEILDDHFEQ